MAIFSFVSVKAQEINFGVKAGLNLASLVGSDDLDDYDMRTSFHFGAVAEIGISDKFSFQPELLYSAEGAKAEESGFKSTLKLDYLVLPLMAKYYLVEGLSVEAGPQIGFLLSAKSKFEGGDESETEDIKDNLKGIDFGVNFGAGYKLDNGLNFGARYNLGLADINDFDDGERESSSDKIKNGVIQISVGYSF